MSIPPTDPLTASLSAMRPFAPSEAATPATGMHRSRRAAGAAGAAAKVALIPYSDTPPLTTATPPLFRRVESPTPLEGSPLETSGDLPGSPDTHRPVTANPPPLMRRLEASPLETSSDLPGSPDTHRPVTANPISASPPGLADATHDLPRSASASSLQDYAIDRDLHSPYTEKEKGPARMSPASAAGAAASMDTSSSVKAAGDNRTNSNLIDEDLLQFSKAMTEVINSYDPENPNASRIAMLFAKLKQEGKI